MPQEALAEDEKRMALEGTNPDWIRSLRRAHQADGWRGYFRKILARALERAKREYVVPSDIADAYALAGDKEQAFPYLDKANAERANWITGIKMGHDSAALPPTPPSPHLRRPL